MNLKYPVLIFLFFICLCGNISAEGSPDRNNNNNFDGRWAVHVTSEIVNDIHRLIQNSRITIADLQRLDLRLSKPVFITPVTYNSARSVEGVDEDGVLIRSQNNVSPSGAINVTERGTLRTIDPDIIVVLFTEENIPLKFKRNSQGRYDLFSAEIGIETNALYYEGGPPQLLVIDRPPVLNDRFDVQAAPLSSPGVSQRDDPAGGGGSADQFDRSRNVNARGSVTQRGIAEYVRSQNPSVNQGTLNSLIETYISEAGSEGINHDIAIAQMLYATNNLSSQRVVAHNYGGLNPEGTSWNGSFSDMTEGVRAHIQHLKGYASTQPPRAQIVDPRYHLLANLGYLGTARTFDDLYRLWMGNSTSYGNSIDRILNELYRYSAN
jgi:hypothetical protein